MDRSSLLSFTMARLTSKRRAEDPGMEIVSNFVLDLNLYIIVDMVDGDLCSRFDRVNGIDSDD